MEEGGLFGLTTEQINNILQAQGFSFETFMEMPADLQADILQNVQLQGQMEQQPHQYSPAHRLAGQSPVAQPNTPVVQPNTPVVQPRIYPNIIIQGSEQLQPQQQQQQQPV